MKRGDVVTVALPGDLGKPRPAVVLLPDLLADATSRVIVLPMTTTLAPAPLLRVNVWPSRENGLRQECQIMVDRVASVSRGKIGATIGQLEKDTVAEATQRLLVLIGAE